VWPALVSGAIPGGVGHCQFIRGRFLVDSFTLRLRFWFDAFTLRLRFWFDAFTVYAYLTKDFTAMSAIHTHHQYIAGFFLLGAFAHGAIYLIRDANLTPGAANNSLRARFVTTLLQYRSAIISHAITLFLGFHTLGLYVHNDVMQAFGTPEFEISFSPVFGQWLQVAHGQNVGSPLSCCDGLVHHAIALGLHTTVLVLLSCAQRPLL
jgi:Photosystem I psaA/psaB protein